MCLRPAIRKPAAAHEGSFMPYYEKKGFTTGDVAALCHVTIPTVIKWIESRELDGFKIPGSKNRRITRDSLMKFMKKYNIPTTELEKRKPRILVVDDEEEILELFKVLLEESKYEIRLVSRGFDAGLAKEFMPDLIILDIMLPDIDGSKVCEYIRAMPEMKKVKILAISGYVKDQQGFDELIEKGFDDYVRKPFDNDILMENVERLLNKSSRKKKK